MDGQTVHVKIELFSDTLPQNLSAAVEKHPFEDGDEVPKIPNFVMSVAGAK